MNFFYLSSCLFIIFSMYLGFIVLHCHGSKLVELYFTLNRLKVCELIFLKKIMCIFQTVSMFC